MKYRKSSKKRVAYGFNGRLQDDLEAYQGFLEIANHEGWEVVVLYEQFEQRIRLLVEAKGIEGIVGKFMSEVWLKGLPDEIKRVHLGDAALPSVASVYPDTRDLGKRVAEHLVEMNYAPLCWFSPVKMQDMLEGMRDSGEEVHAVRTLSELQVALEKFEKPGVFCASDYHSRLGIKVAEKIGKPPPSDCGFVGIGDRFWDGVAAGVEISSVQVPHREMGRTAGQLLAEAFQGKSVRHVKIRTGSLISRESSLHPEANAVLLNRVEAMFRKDLKHPPLIEDLARKCGRSRRGFELAFFEQAGATPYEYMLQMRTQEAERLLRETDWHVARIGEEIGVPDPARFSSFFKKRTGQSPKKYREQFSSKND
jgi:AraC-like DNA-binding protein